MVNKNIIVSCDTTIAMSKQEIEKYELNVIPLNAIADGVEYHDTVDIDSEKLSQLMRDGAKITTSTPTITEIEDYFDNLFEKTKADLIIHYTISSKLSSMFSLFTTVCGEKYGDKVIVVDSMSICRWMANQVLMTKQLLEEGKEPLEAIEIVKNTLQCSEECVFVPESLVYLKRGGRITPTVAAIANLIGVIPVLLYKDGEVGKKGITRTMRKAFLSAIEEWKEKFQDLKDNYKMIIVFPDNKTKEKIDKTIEILKEYMPDMDYVVSRISLNVTAHAGPGTIGLGIIKNDLLDN